MRLLRTYLRRELPRLVENGIRLTVIGRRDRLAPPLARAIARAERLTRDGARLHLRIAIDYSARASIATAARRALGAPVTLEEFREAIERSLAEETQGGAVDLLIRTGGEQRLSDFLLWEAAYAELWFTSRMWPEFNAADLAAAVEAFRRRERRFGALPAPSPVEGFADASA
jgi:undecaprenyl diphosphate synthase